MRYLEKRSSSGLAGLGLLNVSYLPPLDQTEGIPYLIVEVASLFAQSLVKQDVVAGRCRKHHAHADAIGTELLNEFDGVGRVAQ